jgi:hypothetical protein
MSSEHRSKWGCMMRALHYVGVAGLVTTLGLTAGCDQALQASASNDESGPSSGSNAVCVTRRDCSYDIVPVVETEADCACPKCPADAGAISRASATERERQFSKVCGKWAESHACPPTFCEAPVKLACAEGKCSLEGEQGGEP